MSKPHNHNHLWASHEYWHNGVRPTMASFRGFVVERGGDEGIPDSVYSYVASSLKRQLIPNLVAGDRVSVRQIVRDLGTMRKYGVSCRIACLLPLFPTALYQGLWRLRRLILGRSPRLPKFRSVYRD